MAYIYIFFILLLKIKQTDVLPGQYSALILQMQFETAFVDDTVI